MKTYKLVEAEDHQEGVPSCLLSRCKDREKFPEQFQSISYVTDLVKEEILERMNSRMTVINKDEIDCDTILKDYIYLQAMKEVLDLLP